MLASPSTLSGIQVPLLFFNNDVALQNIQWHGTWTPNCLWRYITDSVDCGEQVADTYLLEGSLCFNYLMIVTINYLASYPREAIH